VEGQDEGAMMMGLGHALFERMAYQDGQLVNGNLVDYRVPMIGDVPPEMETVLVENQDGPGPMGCKGVGESATTVMGAAVAAAVYRAVGVRARELPLHPEAVWRALAQPATTAARQEEKANV
jgi:CO/xanthine dehydrogenase Mo-binding subunit